MQLAAADEAGRARAERECLDIPGFGCRPWPVHRQDKGFAPKPHRIQIKGGGCHGTCPCIFFLLGLRRPASLGSLLQGLSLRRFLLVFKNLSKTRNKTKTRVLEHFEGMGPLSPCGHTLVLRSFFLLTGAPVVRASVVRESFVMYVKERGLGLGRAC